MRSRGIMTIAMKHESDHGLCGDYTCRIVTSVRRTDGVQKISSRRDLFLVSQSLAHWWLA